MFEIIDPHTGRTITTFGPDEELLANAFVKDTDFQIWATVPGATMQVA